MKADLAKLHHARSAKDFPGLDLMSDEYVVLAIGRSRLGLILIWAGEIAGFVALTVVLFLLIGVGDKDALFRVNASAKSYIYMFVFALYGLLIITGLVGTWLYKNNHLYITNKRAIQHRRPNLLAKSVSIIDLQSIEDVSFRQSGLMDYMLRMGTIRMATVGDETTYTFAYADTPRDEIKIITHLVHGAKEKRRKLSD